MTFNSEELEAVAIMEKNGARLHWATYHAAVRRDGVFRLMREGEERVESVNFNEDLAKPIYQRISIPWLSKSEVLHLPLQTGIMCLGNLFMMRWTNI